MLNIILVLKCNQAIFPVRMQNRGVLRSSLSKIRALRQQFPTLVAGFDVAHHEDEGHDLIYYIEEFLEPSLEEEEHLPYILHAGETSLFHLHIICL